MKRQAPSSKSQPKSSVILIVEDEHDLSFAYQRILQQAGYTVKAAYDGEQALALAAEEEPTLILLDLRMPRMDGIEFLRNYKAREEHPKVKIIVFSNYDMQKEIDEAYKLGADRYILKALASPLELQQIVKNTLKASE
jgi:CheY-like chemotaxis protein